MTRIRNHYNYGSMEPIEVIESMGDIDAFYRGNIIKYLMRYRYSEDPEGDLNKLCDYAERLRVWESKLCRVCEDGLGEEIVLDRESICRVRDEAA